MNKGDDLRDAFQILDIRRAAGGRGDQERVASNDLFFEHSPPRMAHR
jgi:hypothetical protein